MGAGKARAKASHFPASSTLSLKRCGNLEALRSTGFIAKGKGQCRFLFSFLYPRPVFERSFHSFEAQVSWTRAHLDVKRRLLVERITRRIQIVPTYCNTIEALL